MGTAQQEIPVSTEHQDWIRALRENEYYQNPLIRAQVLGPLKRDAEELAESKGTSFEEELADLLYLLLYEVPVED